MISQAGAPYHGAELPAVLLQALQAAGLEKGANPEGYGSLDKTRVGVLVGSGMGGLTGGSRMQGLHTPLAWWVVRPLAGRCVLAAILAARSFHGGAVISSFLQPIALLQCSRTA